MKFNEARSLSDSQFRRATGVKFKTFSKMVEIVRSAHKKKKKKGGRPNKLTIEDMVLMTLEYLREYRTYLNIGTSYGLSESNAFTNIRWVEDVLIKSKEFRLPGKKALLNSDNKIKTILIDVAESPIERPKKNSVNSIQGKKRDTL